MATEPREALIGIVLDALASDECSYTAAEQAADRIRAWALEPAQIERAARHLVRSRGAPIVASDAHWPAEVARFYRMCREYPDYADGHSLITDAFRDARAALTALFGGDDGK